MSEGRRLHEQFMLCEQQLTQCCPNVRCQGGSDVILFMDSIVRFTNPSHTSTPHILPSGVTNMYRTRKGTEKNVSFDF